METIVEHYGPALTQALSVAEVDPYHVRCVVGDIARAAILRYSPSLKMRQHYGQRGAPSARWMSGSPEGETNDCAVRALANVSSMTYEQAHALVADQCGRVNRKGPNSARYIKLLDSLATRVAFRPNSCTLAAFARQHPRGFYLVWITGHALAMIDGRVIDSHVSGPRTRVYGAWKFAD